MNKIYKLPLLSYFFFLGCANYTPDLMAAYVYARDVERAKFRKEQCKVEDFEARIKQLYSDNAKVKDKIKQKQGNKAKPLTNFEKQILNGNVEKRFKQFESFIKNAFKDTKNQGMNDLIRDFAAYATLSQPIFNILMYVFAGLDDSKALKTLSIVCKLLRFFNYKTVIEILVQCENFYKKDTYSNFPQEFKNLYENIMRKAKDSVDKSALSCISELNFSENEIRELSGTLIFLLSNKNFFKTSGENKLQSVLSSYQKK